MKALILAAGFGTRLGTFGETTPKGLIQAGETTLLGNVIVDLLRSDGAISEIAMITNQRFAQKYGEWLVDTGYDRSLQFVINGANKPEERLGALGDILYAMQELHWDDDLLVLPSDTYYAFKLRDFIQFATEHAGFSTVLAKVPKERIAGRLGCAVLKDETIVSFVEKPAEPPSDLAAIPFYYYPKATLHELKAYQQEGNSMDAPGSIIPWLLFKDIPVYGYQTDGRTLDVGTTADIKTLSQL